VNAQGVDNPMMLMSIIQQAQARGETMCHVHLDTATAIGPGGF